MDVETLKLIESFKRSIRNDNGKICLETEGFENIEHAFYLEHSKGKEKKLYSNQSSNTFDIPFKRGVYGASFFYRVGGERKSIFKSFSINSNGEIANIEKSTIAEEEGWKIDFYNTGSEITFIVFNAAKGTKNTKPFGLQYLVPKGYNVLACLHNNNHYQSLSFDKMKEVVLPIVENHEVFLYGSSLGGYCAIYYAGAVNGTAIAAAPRNSFHPLLAEKINNKNEMRRFEHADIYMNPTTSKDVYIIFDPLVEKDIFYIENMIKPAYSMPYLIKVPYAGHPVLYHLNSTKQLNSIIESIVAQKPQEIQVDEGIESSYTDAGKARQFFYKQDYYNAKIYANKALMDVNNKLGASTRRELMKFIKSPNKD